jgi:hypothetical protein
MLSPPRLRPPPFCPPPGGVRGAFKTLRQVLPSHHSLTDVTEKELHELAHAAGDFSDEEEEEAAAEAAVVEAEEQLLAAPGAHAAGAHHVPRMQG